MIEQEQAIFNSQVIFTFLEKVAVFIQSAAQSGTPIDEVEDQLWNDMLNLGQLLLQKFVDLQGTGDFGPTLEQEGKTLRRLDTLHEKRYVSVFGELKIQRTIYGTRENQKHEVVPLDARLNLPESDFSYLLQDWSQALCVHDSYQQSSTTLERILGIGLSVRSLEHMNQAMAQEVEEFRKAQPIPDASEEGSLLVVTADGKGVPMRRDTPVEPGRRKRGEKANSKRQACVGAVYTINPFPRQANEIVEEVFREERQKKRPSPQQKRVRAELTREMDGEEVNGKDRIFEWFEEEMESRNPGAEKAVVCLMDGDRALWNKVTERELHVHGILDLYHVMERIWKAAYCFCAEGSEEAEAFVKQRLERILEGKVGRVIGGFRQMMTKQNLRGEKKKQLENVISYFENNQEYMQYDHYLKCGYPIGSGVVEGACRHLVKDRMERTGMRWRTEGAQAMLDLRSLYLNEEWKDFHKHRRHKNAHNLYPERETINKYWSQAA